MYVINLPLFFQTKQQNHVSFPSLSSVREEEEEVVFKRNRRRLSEKSRKSDWKGTDRSHQKGYPSISHYNFFLPENTVLQPWKTAPYFLDRFPPLSSD